MKKFIIPALALAPMAAFAQNLTETSGLVDAFGDIVALAIPIVVGLALLAFFWGLVKYIFAAGNEEFKEEGKKLMIWGAVAFFVMVSIWGIVRWIQGELGVTDTGDVDVPSVPGL